MRLRASGGRRPTGVPRQAAPLPPGGHRMRPACHNPGNAVAGARRQGVDAVSLGRHQRLHGHGPTAVVAAGSLAAEPGRRKQRVRRAQRGKVSGNAVVCIWRCLTSEIRRPASRAKSRSSGCVFFHLALRGHCRLFHARSVGRGPEGWQVTLRRCRLGPLHGLQMARTGIVTAGRRGNGTGVGAHRRSLWQAVFGQRGQRTHARRTSHSRSAGRIRCPPRRARGRLAWDAGGAAAAARAQAHSRLASRACSNSQLRLRSPCAEHVRWRGTHRSTEARDPERRPLARRTHEASPRDMPAKPSPTFGHPALHRSPAAGLHNLRARPARRAPTLHRAQQLASIICTQAPARRAPTLHRAQQPASTICTRRPARRAHGPASKPSSRISTICASAQPGVRPRNTHPKPGPEPGGSDRRGAGGVAQARGRANSVRRRGMGCAAVFTGSAAVVASRLRARRRGRWRLAHARARAGARGDLRGAGGRAV